MLEELLEQAELGVSRLQDVEDTEEPSNNKAAGSALTSKQSLPAAADASPLSPLEDLYWLEQLGGADPQGEEDEEDILWATGTGDRQVSSDAPRLHGEEAGDSEWDLALTHSPLLFKGNACSASKRTPNFKDEAASGRRTEVEGVEVSPFSQSIRRADTGRSYSRKRLLH
ncbi:hypothetical protein KUCAC02_035937 [Chaenocephalus aceratus]|nr:hypothetical protein KUCAC02_035937 [Chaenocephalus aceratus]